MVKRSANDTEDNNEKRRKMDEDVPKDDKKEELDDHYKHLIDIINNLSEEVDNNQTFIANQAECPKDKVLQENKFDKGNAVASGEIEDLSSLLEDVNQFIENNNEFDEDINIDTQRDDDVYGMNLFPSIIEFGDKTDDLQIEFANSTYEDTNDVVNDVASVSNEPNLIDIVDNHNNMLAKPTVDESFIERTIKSKKADSLMMADKKEDNFDDLKESNFEDQDQSQLVQDEPSTSATTNIKEHNSESISTFDQQNKKTTANVSVDDGNDKFDNDEDDLKMSPDFSDDDESSDDDSNNASERLLVKYLNRLEEPMSPSRRKNLGIHLNRIIKNLIECEPVNENSSDTNKKGNRSDSNPRTDVTYLFYYTREDLTENNGKTVKSDEAEAQTLALRNKFLKILREKGLEIIRCGPVIIKQLRTKTGTIHIAITEYMRDLRIPANLIQLLNKKATLKIVKKDPSKQKITKEKAEKSKALDKVVKQIKKQLLRDKNPTEETDNSEVNKVGQQIDQQVLKDTSPKEETDNSEVKIVGQQVAQQMSDPSDVSINTTYQTYDKTPFLTMQQRLHIYIKRQQEVNTCARSEILPLKNRLRISARQLVIDKNGNTLNILNKASKSIADDQGIKKSEDESENVTKESQNSLKCENNYNNVFNMDNETQNLNVKAFMEGLIANEIDTASNDSTEIVVTSPSNVSGDDQDRDNASANNGHGNMKVKDFAMKNLSGIDKDGKNEDTDDISDKDSKTEIADEIQNGELNSTVSKILIKQIIEVDRQNYDQKNIEDLRRKNHWKFVLPAEYDADNTKWTLKYKEKIPGLTGLGNGVYVSREELKSTQREAKDCKEFAKLLLREIYSKKALAVCASMSEKVENDECQRRPELDLHAWMVLMNKVIKEGYKRNWDTNRKLILDSLHRMVLKYRCRYGILLEIT